MNFAIVAVVGVISRVVSGSFQPKTGFSSSQRRRLSKTMSAAVSPSRCPASYFSQVSA